MAEKTPVKERAAAAKERVTAAKKEIKQRVAQKVKPASPNTVTSNRLKLLVTIVGRNKAEYYTDLIQSFEVNMQMVVLASGTANAKMLGLLGLTDSEKVVILGVIQENKIPDALHTLEQKFNTIKDGKGVACTVPLTSVIGTLIYGFLSNNRLTVKESK
ncbi:MAG: hypothetical protein K2O89_07300 [Clostridia bacterium]|nr:hypothetical protein [Clostridia bacterium]